MKHLSNQGWKAVITGDTVLQEPHFGLRRLNAVNMQACHLAQLILGLLYGKGTFTDLLRPIYDMAPNPILF